MANAIPPAPWTAAPWGDNSFDVFDADENRICDIVGCHDNDIAPAAALIVAAPDLLAALRDCRDWLVAITVLNNNLDETYRGYLRAASEAIEKATGVAD